jgi:DNA-binding NarL/FixJ family response regulator
VGLSLLQPFVTSASAIAGPKANGEVLVELLPFCQRFSLTSRQRSVLHMLVSGRSQKEIAVNLSVTPATARRHAQELYRRCGTRSQRELLALVVRAMMSHTGDAVSPE